MILELLDCSPPHVEWLGWNCLLGCLLCSLCLLVKLFGSVCLSGYLRKAWWRVGNRVCIWSWGIRLILLWPLILFRFCFLGWLLYQSKLGLLLLWTRLNLFFWLCFLRALMHQFGVFKVVIASGGWMVSLTVTARKVSVCLWRPTMKNTKDEKNSNVDLEPISLLISRLAIMTMIITVMIHMITHSV